MAKKKASVKKAVETKTVAPKRRRVRVGAEGRNILNVDTPKGLVGRWVNDTDDGRIKEMEARGYEVYTGQDLSSDDGLVDGSDGVAAAMTKNVGKGMTAVFMVQRQEYYDEDQSDKQKQIDAVERTILTNDEDGRYGKIKIEN